MRNLEILKVNRAAWDHQVKMKARYTIPVSSRRVARARRGKWSIRLTPSLPVPREWFPSLTGAHVLCLASGGGQQGPILAAAGAVVTVLDNSPLQLEQDKRVSARDQLGLRAVLGDMADLRIFEDQSFHLIVHPCSNCFAKDVRTVWKEAYRVLKPGGSLLSGFGNPDPYLFDPASAKRGVFRLRHKMPYSDLKLSQRERRRYFGAGAPIEFAHSLEDQIGGQLDAGFHLAGFYEDDWGGAEKIDRYMKSFIATRAIKPMGKHG